MTLEGIAVVDTPVTDRVRVRSWHHRFGATQFPEGSHAEVEVGWVIVGEARYLIDGSELVVPAGSGIVVPARTAHATHVSDGIVAQSAWIAASLVSNVAASLALRPPSAARLIADATEISRLGSLLETEARTPRPGQSLMVESLAQALVVAVLRAASNTGVAPRDPRIAQAVALLETHFADALGVDDLARAAGISRFHFSRLFREETGESPYQYLRRLRIERARELLALGYTVTDAALSVGFKDLSRFARAFREQTGVAPSAFGRRAV
ncbi:MAG: helix-turn-helix transcriptional regulator [Myxococcales bacterium]|nr:helix-turn-helix transcriptional regulator [Myxococcales bacterium]MCB9576296.1 helix-turn-helix transcriptional regulator [Polyangiaceae bacterium]